MKFAQAAVIALAVFALGAGIVKRSRSLASFEPAPSRRAGRVEAASGLTAAPDSLVPEKSPVLAAAGGLYTTRQTLTSTLRKLNGRGVPLSPEELLLVRQLEGRISEHTQSLRLVLGAESSGWSELIDFLGRLPDAESALLALEAVRESMTPSGASSVAACLRPDAPRGVRRFSILALGNQNSDDVLSALATLAAEDPESALRSAALQSLGDRRNQLKGTQAGVLVEETLRRQSAADPDPETRDRARALLEAPSAPPPPVRVPRPPRGPFGRG